MRDAAPRLLIFAYACEPDRGSEPGAGWGLVRAYARMARCTVLVGSEHTAALAEWTARNPGAAVTFVTVPEPRWGGIARRHRITWFLLYLAWLRRARRVALRLHRADPFDAACHATYSTYWLPSPAAELGIPCIWGPVGGAVITPPPLRPVLGWRGLPGELLDAVAVRVMAQWPATRRTWARASVVLAQNAETLRRFPPAVARKARVLNHACFVEAAALAPAERSDRIVLAAPLEARKGVRLALRALALAPTDVRLTIIGDGPDRAALERLARRLGVARRVEFTGRLPRPRVHALMRGARAVLFTGLREEGGLALAEAMTVGAAVIVLASGGARTIAERTTDPSRVVRIVPDGVEATARRMAEAMVRCWRYPSRHTGPTLSRDDAHSELGAALAQALAGGDAGAAPCALEVCA